MILFVTSVIAVLVISAACSLAEAALYSVRLPYVRRLADHGSAAGLILKKFKHHMDRPIAAILILNTAANTAGAAVAGAQASRLFGEHALLAFSVIFTFLVLFFSEIIPKLLGVVYSQPVARHIAVPVNVLIALLSPLITAVEKVSMRLRPSGPVFSAPEDEVRQLAMVSAEEGSIMKMEAEIVKNALALDRNTAREVMTPRAVVLKLADDLTVREAAEQVGEWTFSRIPVFAAEDPEHWLGVVLSRNILETLAKGELDVTLGTLVRPADTVTEETRGHVLLRNFIKSRQHLALVADEYGSIVGIVTLEDVLESLIGEEIMDEVDITEDLQEFARGRHRRRRQRSKSARKKPKLP